MSAKAQRKHESLRSYDKLFVGGRWTNPSSSSVIDVISPTTEENIARVPEGQAADIDAAVAAARRAFDSGPWPRMSPQQRLVTAEEVAAVALLLASAEGRGINGQAINVDGGTVLF